jgi:protein angel
MPLCLVSNTHLTFPHSAYDAGLRLAQGRRLLDHLDATAARLGLAHLPVVVAGDLNGDMHDAVYAHLAARGFRSAALAVLGREAGVTHLTHRGDAVAVDFVLFRYARHGVIPTLRLARDPHATAL